MDALGVSLEQDFDPPAEIDGVEILRFPQESDRAAELAQRGTARLLLVAPGVDPPAAGDALVDWLRAPADDQDVHRCVVSLREAASQVKPILGDHDMLWRGSTWIALTPIEARIMSAFLARPSRVLSRARLESHGWPAGVPNSRAIDAHIKVLRRRVEPAGVVIHTVRGRGYLAEIQAM